MNQINLIGNQGSLGSIRNPGQELNILLSDNGEKGEIISNFIFTDVIGDSEFWKELLFTTQF